MENAPNSNNDKAVGWVSNPPTTPIGVDNTVKSNLRFDGGLETHPTAETTISVILSDSEKSLSNNKDSSLDAQNDDNNKDSSLATQVQNDGNLSGSLKALPVQGKTVIASLRQ
ncbi:MAG: hypothetical protein IJ187_02830 [Neisseriaceae bacterium]|nr:hypothetical protein [Neisseriaceae bacterium]